MQKLEYLLKHYPNIVGVGLIDIPNLWTAENPTNAVTLEEFEVKVLAIEDRAVFVVIPTIITALSVKVIPMRTACLTAHTAQAPVTRARYLVCYHSLPSPLPFLFTFSAHAVNILNAESAENVITKIVKGFIKERFKLLESGIFKV